ncbi:phosphoglucosamine mutase [Defluviicoccus vanus]|uniref:Phosphoglucosamine mutase n=1 Tax=Defluviicoccus vanus TaxID=111831 RepID=A0A7H1N580_9PROT|nr:phosphoglucosamine mutase [Defluviicoccus vanus]QNT70866.1 phosphoglucosamine mutase [Defluviicoccus vanus]
MGKKLFGTDGIRGKANAAPMTAETALRVGMAAGLHFRRGRHRHRVLIGKDTRLSGYMLEAALTAGFISMGMDVIIVGPMPTPAVAILTRSMRCDLGVMLSASHNPFEDNGIKLFGPDGYKLSDEVEEQIEEHVAHGLPTKLAAPADLGRAKRLHDVHGRYTEFVKSTFPKGLTLQGMRIVLDCANGAAYKVAPEVLWELGAEVIPLGDNPDGININQDCGSTAPEAMCRAVQEYRADFGIALDGDADRALIADETGTLIDGDQLMAIVAKNWQANGKLRKDGIVATVMSNMGLERYLNGLGLTLERTRVGDRYVVEYMRRHGYNIGGEQSGHIIFSDHATTGDGTIAALQVLAVIVASGKRASEVCVAFEPMPQLLRNVRFQGGAPLENGTVQQLITDCQHRLGNSGRLLIRPSGTEPVIRVMAEGEDESLIGKVVEEICDAIRAVAA